MSITEFPGLIAQEVPRLAALRRAIYRLSMPVVITRSSINQKVDDCDARQSRAQCRAISRYRFPNLALRRDPRRNDPGKPGEARNWESDWRDGASGIDMLKFM